MHLFISHSILKVVDRFEIGCDFNLQLNFIKCTFHLELSALSSVFVGNQSYRSTGRQRETVAMTTGASALRTSSATSSRWMKVQDALWTAIRFVFLTLPVGEFF